MYTVITEIEQTERDINLKTEQIQSPAARRRERHGDPVQIKKAYSTGCTSTGHSTEYRVIPCIRTKSSTGKFTLQVPVLVLCQYLYCTSRALATVYT